MVYSDKDLKRIIKLKLIEKDMTIKDLVEIINKRFDRGTSYNNFTNKLAKGSFRYEELMEIVDSLGLQIKLVEKNEGE